MTGNPTPRRGTTFIPVIPSTDHGTAHGSGQAAPPTPDADAKAREVVGRMIERDAFSKWLGVEVVEIADKRAVIRMTVRPEMANGFGYAHGGIAFAFADSAHAFCSNSAGEISVATDCHISYPAAIKVGDVITATAEERTETNRLAFSDIVIRNQDDRIVALFKGTVYRTKKPLP
jgi:acyl-CoA thioesterase